MVSSLTFQYVPYTDIDGLTSNAKIEKLLNVVKKNKIVLMQGRLKPNEETRLIEKTMSLVSKEFKGIELCTIYPENKRFSTIGKQLKNNFYKLIAGDREGLTIIGPATIIKEIKRNPDKIELFTKNSKR